MRELERLKEMLCDEIKKISKQGELTSASLQAADTIVDVIKDIYEITAMEQYDGYDEEGSFRRGMSRNSYRRGNSNYYPMDQYSMGQYDYSNRRGGNSNSYNSNYESGYSRHTATEKMIDELEMMMEDTNNAKDKTIIQRCIEELKNK